MRAFGIILILTATALLFVVTDSCAQLRNTQIQIRDFTAPPAGPDLDGPLRLDTLFTANNLGLNDTLDMAAYIPNTYRERVLFVAVLSDRELYYNVDSVQVVKGASVTTMDTVRTGKSGGTTPREKLYVYKLVNPDTGAVTIRVRLYNASRYIAVGALMYSGVDQTTPISTPALVADSVDTPSLNVTTTTSTGTVLAFAGGQNASAPYSGETELFEVTQTTSTDHLAAYSEPGTGGTVNISVDYTSSNRSIVIAFNIRRAP